MMSLIVTKNKVKLETLLGGRAKKECIILGTISLTTDRRWMRSHRWRRKKGKSIMKRRKKKKWRKTYTHRCQTIRNEKYDF
jgi:hypothetical protein